MSLTVSLEARDRGDDLLALLLARGDGQLGVLASLVVE
jgi:hypothetical protein